MGQTNKIFSFEDLECWKACREVRMKFSGVIKKMGTNSTGPKNKTTPNLSRMKTYIPMFNLFLL